MYVCVRHSKRDQDGLGLVKDLPYGSNKETCPGSLSLSGLLCTERLEPLVGDWMPPGSKVPALGFLKIAELAVEITAPDGAEKEHVVVPGPEALRSPQPARLPGPVAFQRTDQSPYAGRISRTRRRAAKPIQN